MSGADMGDTVMQYSGEEETAEVRQLGRGSIAHVRYTGDEAQAEINTLLAAVVADEDEYNNWVALVDRAAGLEGGVTRNSSPSSIELVRNVFDCFLAKFPLFYGYWKRYADLEFSIGGTETAEMVYERGVSCVPLAVDLWTNYCAFKTETCHDNDIIRELFERGSEFVALDYHSHPFWDKYIELEERATEFSNITKIHERLIHLPIYQCERYYQKFRILITTRPLEELTDSETLEKIKGEVRAQNEGLPEKSDLELDRMLRAQLDTYYYGIYIVTAAEVQKRWNFENALKRPFFHSDPLSEDEQANWRKYLDFEESEGDIKRITYLYERCMVACALYEEFWLRYVRWMSAQGRDEDTRIIFNKASCTYVPIVQPTIRLLWARFEEKHERIQTARDIHLAILDQLPENEHRETIVSLANLERRQEGVEAALQCLEKYVNERGETLSAQLTTEQVRILWQCTGDIDRARDLFKTRHDRYRGSRDFWDSYLKFEIGQPSMDEEEAHIRIKGVYDLMHAEATFSPSTMKELSHKYMEYLLDRSGKKAAEEYILLDREVNGARTLQSQSVVETAQDVKMSAQP